jgi:hypothetical protein
VIPHIIFFALNPVKGPFSGTSNECCYSKRKSRLQRTPRQFVRVTRVRQLILAMVFNVRRITLRLTGFPWNSGLVRKARRILYLTKVVSWCSGEFPRARRLRRQPWHVVWYADMCHMGGIVGGQWQSAVRARTGYDDRNHMETLVSPVIQPKLVIPVTESRERHHRSPSGALRIYPCIARGDVWYKMSANCWNSSSLS